MSGIDPDDVDRTIRDVHRKMAADPVAAMKAELRRVRAESSGVAHVWQNLRAIELLIVWNDLQRDKALADIGTSPDEMQALKKRYGVIAARSALGYGRGQVGEDQLDSLEEALEAAQFAAVSDAEFETELGVTREIVLRQIARLKSDLGHSPDPEA